MPSLVTLLFQLSGSVVALVRPVEKCSVPRLQWSLLSKVCELCIVYFFAVKMATNASSTPENFVKSTNEAQTSSNAQNSTNSQGKT